jgi:hypothetical protein
VGASEDIEITNGNAWTSDKVTVWVDWDNDFIFDQATDEEFVLTNVGGTGESFTGEITVPQGTQSGEKRMRVRMTYSSDPEPCDGFTYGEVEDYTINVSGWMLVDRITDTIAPGNTKSIDITFNSEDLTQGTYYGNVMVESNDPDMLAVNVPITLNVGDGFPMALNVSANPSTICLGESAQLNTGASGGTGTYTYSWTSDPAGFTSNEANPVVMPDETTHYMVEVDDGETVVDGSVNVTVGEAPDQAAMPEGETDLCYGVFQTVYQTLGAMGASSYNWTLSPEGAGTIGGNAMTATVEWSEDFQGTAMILVGGVNDCGAGEFSDALEVVVHELPVVDLGEDMTICANTSIILDAGNPGASYVWSTGETSQTIEVDTTGVGIGAITIEVEVIDAFTCSGTDEITIQFDDCTGISDLEEQWSVQVYPNPASGIFNIDMKTRNSSPVNLIMLDAYGKEVYRNENVSIQEYKSLSIDLNGISDGIYLLNIKGNGINMIRKIMIQK